jgi:hypothetical protein
MSMDEKALRNWLLNNAFTKDGMNINTHVFRDKNSSILKSLEEYTGGLRNVGISTRIRAFLNGQFEFHRCIICGNEITKFSNKNPQIYCSVKCRNKGGSIKSKRTFIRRYGVEWLS